MNLSVHMRMVNDFHTATFKIYFVGYDRQKHKIYLLKPVKNKFEWIEHVESQVLPDDCFITLALPQIADFKKNLLLELDIHNFQNNTDDKELKATKHHLEDMRKLVFTKNPNQSDAQVIRP